MDSQTNVSNEPLSIFLFFNEKDQKEYRYSDKNCELYLIDDSFNHNNIFQNWVQGGKIIINILLLDKISQNQKLTLKNFFNSDEFQNNLFRLKINFIYDDELKEYALDVYCELKKLNKKISDFQNILLFSKKEQIDHEIISSNIGLDIVKIYYDVDAISETLTINPKTGYEYPEALKRQIENEGILDERFWYWHPESTRLWRMLTFAPDYSVYHQTKELLTKHITQIVDELFVNVQNKDTIDFIDLGVGSPDKDKIIIDEILSRFHNDNENSDHFNKLNFYMFDISFSLILQTISHILPIKRNQKPPNQFEVIPIVGDFNHLNKSDYQELLGEPNPKLIALLGNTIGNISENEILNNLLPYIQDNGYLLVDVEFCDDITKEELLAPYSTRKMFNFVFHPLRLTGRIKKIPHEAFNSYKVDLVNSDRIDYSFGRRGASHSVSDIEGCKIVSMKYDDGPNKEYLLAWSTKYSKRQFDAHLISSGFNIVHEYHLTNKKESKSPRYGLYLLQKK